jgi:hypothetical protein
MLFRPSLTALFARGVRHAHLQFPAQRFHHIVDEPEDAERAVGIHFCLLQVDDDETATGSRGEGVSVSIVCMVVILVMEPLGACLGDVVGRHAHQRCPESNTQVRVLGIVCHPLQHILAKRIAHPEHGVFVIAPSAVDFVEVLLRKTSLFVDNVTVRKRGVSRETRNNNFGSNQESLF